MASVILLPDYLLYRLDKIVRVSKTRVILFSDILNTIRVAIIDSWGPLPPRQGCMDGLALVPA